MTDSLQAMYATSDAAVRGTFGQDRLRALDYYKTLVDFVRAIRPPEGEAGPVRLLDAGCGCGWSTYACSVAGYDAAGIDLNGSAFEPPQHDRCQLVQGSATDIPFPAESFDVVICFQCLEHVPDPGRALDEFARVCRPGGVVVIVGPNLVSPFPGLAYAIRPSSWRSLGFLRRPTMARHPYGNTIPEIIGTAFLRAAQLLAKLVRRSPQFSMREPDNVPPFHSDNDACYLCNPTDLIAYFKSRGFAIERRGKPGRPPLSYLFAGGTWVAARKPAAK